RIRNSAEVRRAAVPACVSGHGVAHYTQGSMVVQRLRFSRREESGGGCVGEEQGGTHRARKEQQTQGTAHWKRNQRFRKLPAGIEFRATVADGPRAIHGDHRYEKPAAEERNGFRKR